MDDESSEDGDANEANDTMERIPARFRTYFYGSVAVDRSPESWQYYDIAMTTAGELFWFDHTISNRDVTRATLRGKVRR